MKSSKLKNQTKLRGYKLKIVSVSKTSNKSRFKLTTYRIAYNAQHRFQYSTKLRRIVRRTPYVTHFTIV